MLKRPVDNRCDLCLLGVALFECLTGQLPFVAITVLDSGEAVLRPDSPMLAFEPAGQVCRPVPTSPN